MDHLLHLHLASDGDFLMQDYSDLQGLIQSAILVLVLVLFVLGFFTVVSFFFGLLRSMIGG